MPPPVVGIKAFLRVLAADSSSGAEVVCFQEEDRSRLGWVVSGEFHAILTRDRKSKGFLGWFNKDA